MNTHHLGLLTWDLPLHSHVVWNEGVFSFLLSDHPALMGGAQLEEGWGRAGEGPASSQLPTVKILC